MSLIMSLGGKETIAPQKGWKSSPASLFRSRFVGDVTQRFPHHDFPKKIGCGVDKPVVNE